MTLGSDPLENQLLAALPEAEWLRWQPRLEPVDMPLGQVLYESGSKMAYVYFPTTAIVSLLYVLEDGASAEIAIVGHEGIVGVSLFMGGESTPSRALVQSAGKGFRLKADLMLQEFNRTGPALHLLLRYTQALITQNGFRQMFSMDASANELMHELAKFLGFRHVRDPQDSAQVIHTLDL